MDQICLFQFASRAMTVKNKPIINEVWLYVCTFGPAYLLVVLGLVARGEGTKKLSPPPKNTCVCHPKPRMPVSNFPDSTQLKISVLLKSAVFVASVWSLWQRLATLRTALTWSGWVSHKIWRPHHKIPNLHFAPPPPPPPPPPPREYFLLIHIGSLFCRCLWVKRHS